MTRDPNLPPAGDLNEAEGDPKAIDEVAAAKARLLAATHEPGGPADPAHKINAFLREHPYLAAGAALGAGLLVARVRTLRKLATVGGVWAAKRMLARYIKNMAR